MPSRAEIEKSIAALQAQLENADTDDEVWIKDGDHEIKVSGKRATAILGRYAKLWEAEEDDGEEESEGESEDEKPKREGLFKPRGK